MARKRRRATTAPRIEDLETRTLLSLDGWQGYALDPQHTAVSPVAADGLGAIRWQAPVDLAPQYSGNDLLIHYGSPLVTAANTVIVPVKTGASGGFELQARSGDTGALKWTLTSDYALMPSGGTNGYDWTPTFGPTLTPSNRLAYAAPGGTVAYTDTPDAAGPSPPATGRLAFLGLSNYNVNPAAYNSTVFINTPITSDAAGDLFFGFLVTGSNPLGLTSGVARIGADGTGSSVAVVAGTTQVATNSAPALSNDGNTLYVLESSGNFGSGQLVALDSHTLAVKAHVALMDPHNPANPATIINDASASPTVGPDGDVFIGVLENPFASNHDRGWLLHFSGDLATGKTPGAFGWDDTASVVPASMVPSYHGSSAYLLMTKYNNYASEGGDGVNKLAILDPNATTVDPSTGTSVMREVLTIAGPTPDPEFTGTHPQAVREWCINTAAVDPATDSILANSEDGKLYRWDLATNTFTQQVTLTSGVGEAYTPTLIGVDGTVYAINNATLFAVGDVPVAALDSGGGAAGSFAADADVSGGTTFSTGDAIDTSGVVNAAPQAVYQTERFGNFTYTVPGLSPGASYNVRLHFAEIYWNGPGQRLFNVAINGAPLLSNFDVFAAAGGKDKAIVESFNAVADPQGQITIAYTTVRDNAKSSGIEILTAAPTAPAAPTGLIAAAGNAQIALSWTPLPNAATYDVYRGTTSGGEGATPYRTGLTSPSFTDTGLANGTTYFYQASAVNAAGEGARSAEASATPTGSAAVVAIDSGGGAAGTFAADADVSGGTTYSTADAIDTSGVASPAPQAVYQTERFGNFTYTITGLFPGASYPVRLHFAEIYWNAAGQRLFNVTINGQQVLTNFDVFAAAGGKDKAVVEAFTAVADPQGQVVIAYTTVRDNAKSSGIEILPATSTPSSLALDSGGPAAGPFMADAAVAGGSTFSTSDAIDTSGVADAAPQAVYQTERFGNFTYTVPGLNPGASYTVRLHFAEIYWNSAGQRLFNVAINGQQVLTNFDIFTATGGKDRAIVEPFTATADAQGRITIAYTSVRDNAKSSGIEILAT